MRNKIRLDGFVFEYQEDGNYYEARGRVCYDDEHDEIPEPKLWDACDKLVELIKLEHNLNAEKSHSEKGWVEIYIEG